MAQRMDVRIGMAVKSKDGYPLGRIIGTADGAFIVEKGIFFAHDCSVPFRSVETIKEDYIILSLDKDAIHKASLGEVLEATDRLDLEPGQFSEARMDTAAFHHHQKRGPSSAREQEQSVRPIGFDLDPL